MGWESQNAGFDISYPIQCYWISTALVFLGELDRLILDCHFEKELFCLGDVGGNFVKHMYPEQQPVLDAAELAEGKNILLFSCLGFSALQEI